MRFTLKIDTDNAAFEGGNRSAEIAHILREAADEIERTGDDGTCRDINSNRVGNWHLSGLYR